MDFSLLYPTDAPNKGEDTVYITDAMGDFGLYSFFPTNFPVEKYLTKDPKVIRYRQDLFSDFMTISSLNFTFRKGAEQLEIVKELRQFRDGREDNESRLYAIKEIETYLDLISSLYENLRTVRDKLTSAALLSFLKKIEEIQSSEYFQSLKSGVEKLSFSVKQVRSLTIGVNLDATLVPYEAGIIAVNSEYYHSGDIVSRFMRGEKNNSMMTIAPLAAGTSRFLPVKEREALLISINNAVSKIVESGLRSWRHMLRQYFHDKNITFFLNLLEEIKLILCCVEVIEQLREKIYRCAYRKYEGKKRSVLRRKSFTIR